MRSLRWRVIFSHVLPILIVVPLLGLATFWLLRLQDSLTQVESGVQQQMARMQEQAQVMAQAAGKLDALLADPKAAEDFLSSFNLEVTKVTLVDNAGRIVASTDASQSPRIGQPDGATEVASVLDGQGAVQIAVTGDTGERLAEIAIPVLADDRSVQGVLLLSQSISGVQTQVSNLSTLLLVIVGALLVLGVLLGLLLALRMSRSLEQVTGAIEGIARGETPATFPGHDVAEVDALYQSVNTLTERLHTLEDARRRLLANLVHELGRPLGSIRAAVHALRKGAVEDDALRDELLSGINMQVEQMQPLLENLTQLHGQVLGSLELKRVPTPLSPWIAQVMSLWREAAREKRVVWKSDIPLTLPTAEIDNEQMARALGNLLSNAVKFTPPGGRIVVNAIELAPEAPGEPLRIAITVADSGPGIQPADQARIFEPFQRGAGDRRFPQGVGLGLSIARDIAQAHDGAITLESTPGKGSRFSLEFPAG